MADGTLINKSTITGGDTIDDEQIGAVKVPRSKIALGVRGTDDGDVSASSPMPVTGTIVGSVSVSNLPTTQPVSGSVAVTNLPATQPVSAVALPLPTGAAADATITARLATLGQKTAAGSAPVVIASDQGALPVAGTVAVSNLPTTQPVSGSVAVSNFPATQPISAAALPLPTGAAADATLTGGAAKTQVTNFPATQPVSAAALPLPTGAAQDATITARLGTLGSKTSAGSAPVVIASDQAAVPVSGSVAVSNLPATQPISAAALPLPAGAATDATLTARLGTLGQKTGAASSPVVVASDQSSLPVTVGNFPATQPVSAVSLPLPTGAALDATISARLGTLGSKTSAGSSPVVIASDQSAVPVSVAALPLPTGAALDATLTGGTAKARITDGTNTANVKPASTAAVATDPALVVALSPNTVQLPAGLGSALSAASLPIVVASDQAAIPTKPNPSATATQTSVAGSATNVVVLASNAARKGAAVFNDSTALLYLKLGATASTTSHTVQMQPNAYYEIPFNYTGEIDGLWASAAGSARVTELT